VAFGAVVGEAVIKVVADSSGFERAVGNLGRSTSGAFGRATQGLQGAAGRIGTRIGQALGNGVSRAFRFAARNLRRIIIGLGATLAAVAGLVAVKGFRRFADIEDATRALTIVLGDAVAAAGLLDKVLKVVEGTPFALDQFTQATQVLAATNIEVSKIPGILEAIADSAAASGRGAEGVDLVVDALSRMATQSTLSLEPIRNLEELGVPALRILANQAGISADDMAKSITAGSVDSKTAIDDLVEGIKNGTTGIAGSTAALGGVAKGLGTTVRGAFENMQIAVARAGAKIIAAFNQTAEGGHTLSDILIDIRDAIDIVGERAAGLANKLVGTKGFDKFVEFFDKLPGRVSKAFDLIDQKGLRGALNTVFGKIDFATLADKVISGIARAFDKLPHEKFSQLVTNVIVASILAVADSIDIIVRTVIQVAPKVIAGIGRGLLGAAQDHPVGTGILVAMLAAPGVGPLLTRLLAGIFGALPFGFITGPLIRGLGTALQAGFRLIFGPGLLTTVGTGLARVGAVIAGAIPAIGSAIAAAAPAVAVALGVALGVILHKLIETFVPGINRMLEGVGAAIFTFFADTLPNFFSKTLPRVIGGVVSFFAQLPGRILGVLGTLGQRLGAFGVRAMGALARGLGRGIGAVFTFLAGLKDRIIRNLIGFIGRLIAMGLRLGMNLVRGIARGIRNFAHEVIEAIKRLYNRVTNFIKDIFGIGSPSRVFAVFGRNLVEGLAVGIRKTIPILDKSMGQITERLALPTSTPSFNPALATAGAGSPRIFQPGAVQITTGQTNEEVLARKLAFQLGRESER
jgi:tape measure domain-containing protein